MGCCRTKAVALNSSNSVEMIVGKRNTKNGKVEIMDTEMVLDPAEGRTYAPFRAISEGLGYQVDYTLSGAKVYNKEIPQFLILPGAEPARTAKDH